MKIENCMGTGSETDVFFSLGSNEGDRRLNLETAVQMLSEELGSSPEAVSEFLETEPWGFESDEKFLNAVVHYRLIVPRGTCAEDFGKRLLKTCKGIEKSLGRTGEPEYGTDGKRIYRSRPADIDILLIGDERIDVPELKVPHPLMKERDFVLIPLKEIMTEEQFEKMMKN